MTPSRPAAALALALLLAPAARAATPITLDEALTRASQRSTDLALARADVAGADADRMTSLAGVLPRLDLSASFGHDFTGEASVRRAVIEDVTLDLPATAASDQESYDLGLRLSQPLFDWATFRDVARARFSARAAERQYDEAALAVSFAVTSRFYEVVRAERTLVVLERTSARSEELVTRAEALFAAGRTPRSEVLQARTNLATDRVAVEAQRIRVAQAKNALAEALGDASGEELSVVAPAALEGAAAAPSGPPSLDELLRIARERRPVLAAEAALVSAADAAVDSARGGYLPTLSAQASYFRRGERLGGDVGVYDDPTRNFTATTQLVLSWNLFEGRRTVAGVRRAEASLARARAAQGRTEAQVTREIADARAAASALASQIALAAESLAVAGQGLDLARERLDAGLATQLELRDASLKLTQAELSLLEARIDHAVASADVARAVGGPF